jgi:curli biogenesis system outer membrane secretion channel CsgG
MFRVPCLPIIVLCGALLAAGCAPKVTVFTHPDADMAFYTRVGIVPFKALGADRFAGEKFALDFNTALLTTGLFEVVDYGIFVNAVQRAAGAASPPSGLTADQMKALGESMGVEGIFVGTVSQYDMVATTSGRFPAITVEVRFVDVATGTVVWSATSAERGGPKTPVIGIGETHTLGALSQSMCRELVSKLK